MKSETPQPSAAKFDWLEVSAKFFASAAGVAVVGFLASIFIRNEYVKGSILVLYFALMFIGALCACIGV